MSFLSVLKSIGHVVAVSAAAADAVAPVLAMIPGVGPAAAGVVKAISTAEELIPGAGQGAAKKTVATTIVQANHPEVDHSTLGEIIDAIVGALNALKAAFAKLPAG
jgi:hypothetical protein